MTSDKVLIGKIVNAHGIKGDVKVKSFTMNPADVCSYTPLLKSDDSELKIKLRSAGNSDVIIAHIDGVNDRTTAEGLKGTEIFTLKSSIIDEDSDEILLSDLIGFKILNNDSKEIGEVVYLKADYPTIQKRLGNLEKRGVALKPGQTLKNLYDERCVLYEKYAEVVVDEKGLGTEETIGAVLRGLNLLNEI